jgi:hypothetical protein
MERMKLLSETEWHEHWVATQSHPASRLIFSTAENFMNAMENRGVENYDQALRDIINITQFSAGDIAEIFVIVGHFWAYGHRFAEQLTYLEQQLVRENIQMAMANQSKVAAEVAQQELF